jgi:hypothetical protein
MYSPKPPSQMPLYPVGQMPHYPFPAAPGAVKVAAGLMYAIAGLQVLGGVILSLSTGFALFPGLLFSVLWVVAARRVRRGRNFGRISATVLFGFYTLILVATLVSNGPPADLIITVGFFWLLTLAIVTLLWLSGSAEYFRRVRTPG